jgi:hypothetical protein
VDTALAGTFSEAEDSGHIPWVAKRAESNLVARGGESTKSDSEAPASLGSEVTCDLALSLSKMADVAANGSSASSSLISLAGGRQAFILLKMADVVANGSGASSSLMPPTGYRLPFIFLDGRRGGKRVEYARRGKRCVVGPPRRLVHLWREKRVVGAGGAVAGRVSAAAGAGGPQQQRRPDWASTQPSWPASTSK